MCFFALSTETEYQPVPRDSKNPHRYERLSYDRSHKYSDFLVWIIEFLPRKSIERIHSAGALYHRYGVSRLPRKSTCTETTVLLAELPA